MRWLRSPGLQLCRVVYSWAGQLYTALMTVYRRIKGISAGLTDFSGIKNAYIFLPTNCTNGHEDNALRKMATGSGARIVTNAMRGHILWRSAFQAHRSRLAYPGTAYPVTIASLCSASSSRFSAALGIARTSSVLHSLARKLVQFVGKKNSNNLWAKIYTRFLSPKNPSTQHLFP